MKAIVENKRFLKTSNSSTFSPESLSILKKMMHPLQVTAGEPIYEEGDLVRHLYFVNKGMVKVTKLTEDGKEYMMHLYHAGDFLGQFDPYQDTRHSFNAYAMEDGEIDRIAKDDLKDLLYQHGELAMEFIKWMGLMQRMTESKFRDLMLFGKLGALCSTLIRMSNSYGVEVDQQSFISLKLTNTELGNFIGCTRENVNRLLQHLKKLDAISIQNGFITILNRKQLEELCQCEHCPKEICRI